MDALQVSPPTDANVAEHAVRPPRPWLVPVVIGGALGLALSGWWAQIYETVPCDPSGSVSFGLAVLFLFGAIATVGILTVIQSQRAHVRRQGRALLLVALAAVPPFLVLTSILPRVIGPC